MVKGEVEMEYCFFTSFKASLHSSVLLAHFSDNDPPKSEAQKNMAKGVNSQTTTKWNTKRD